MLWYETVLSSTSKTAQSSLSNVARIDISCSTCRWNSAVKSRPFPDMDRRKPHMLRRQPYVAPRPTSGRGYPSYLDRYAWSKYDIQSAAVLLIRPRHVTMAAQLCDGACDLKSVSCCTRTASWRRLGRYESASSEYDEQILEFHMKEPSLRPNAGLLAGLAMSRAYTTDLLRPRSRCEPL
jgi:hypothetical protein